MNHNRKKSRISGAISCLLSISGWLLVVPTIFGAHGEVSIFGVYIKVIHLAHSILFMWGIAIILGIISIRECPTDRGISRPGRSGLLIAAIGLFLSIGTTLCGEVFSDIEIYLYLRYKPAKSQEVLEDIRSSTKLNLPRNLRNVRTAVNTLSYLLRFECTRRDADEFLDTVPYPVSKSIYSSAKDRRHQGFASSPAIPRWYLQTIEQGQMGQIRIHEYENIHFYIEQQQKDEVVIYMEAPRGFHYQSRLYKEDDSYESLKWLAENYLEEGMSRRDIEWVLGEAQGFSGEERENVDTWLYSSQMGVSYGSSLLVHFENSHVNDWEWASE